MYMALAQMDRHVHVHIHTLTATCTCTMLAYVIEICFPYKIMYAGMAA